MSDELDLTGRVKVLEHGFHKLETRVDQGFAEIGKSLRALSEQLATKASPPPLKEMLGTAVATAALVAYLMSAANSWFDQKSAPMALTITRIAEQDKNGELAVLKYRVQQLEGKK